jgi:HK97 family phage portal protein
MKLLSALWNKLLPPTERKSGSAWARAWLAGREDTLPAACLMKDAFTQSTWIYSCITALAENVSAIPFRILTGPEDNEKVLQNHPALDLFNHPHPHLDRFQFWELVVTWLCLRGEAFILPSLSSFSSVRTPSTLLVLNPDHVQEVVANHQLAGWRYNAPRYNAPLAAAVFLPEELIHIKLPNPFNFWRGMSPLTVAWLAAQTDYASSQFMKGTMINNADTGLIVTSDEQLTPEQREHFLALLRERKRAAGVADRTVFLPGGVKVEKPTISAVDLQFLENRKFNRQEICAIYKVPQELLGFTEDANRSVSDAARLNFMENRIAPLCRRLEAGILPIIHRFDSGRHTGVRGEFHIEATPVMQAAQRARIDSAAKLFALGVPMNTVNRVLDLGLPSLPHGDTSYLPSKLQKVGPPSADPEPQLSEQPVPRTLGDSEICNLKSDFPNPLARCTELISLCLGASVATPCPDGGSATASPNLEQNRESCLQHSRILGPAKSALPPLSDYETTN